MAQLLAHYLRETLERELPVLRGMTDESTGGPVPAGKWTPKQELGHLLDSALNNHNRFVRAAIDLKYEGPGYQQDAWVSLHDYNSVPWDHLVTLWSAHNHLLVHLIERIPDGALNAPCQIGSYAPGTLAFVIDDYVLHMQYHLDRLTGRQQITRYPREAAP
jgi:hypothetical protein